MRSHNCRQRDPVRLGQRGPKVPVSQAKVTQPAQARDVSDHEAAFAAAEPAAVHRPGRRHSGRAYCCPAMPCVIGWTSMVTR